MFRTHIPETALTTDIANSFFRDRIEGDPICNMGDMTFVSTLRALLPQRMPEGDSIHFYYRECANNAADLEYCKQRGASRIKDYMAIYVNVNSISLCNLTHSPENNEVWFNYVSENFQKIYGQEWVPLPKITEFFAKSFKVSCFVNEGIKSVVLITCNLDIRKAHYLQCSILAFLPWYFDPQKGITDEEMAVINSLREKTPDKYQEAISAIAARYDFRTMQIKRELAGFETRFEQAELKDIERKAQNITTRINQLGDEMGNLLEQRREIEIKMLGLNTKISGSTGESEIMEYFLCNKKLDIYSVYNSTMSFVVKDYITYFDEEMVKSVINSPNSYVYKPDGISHEDIIPPADMKKLMTAIFINQSLKVRVCAAYEFEMGVRVRALSNYAFGHEYSTYMPNPHIDRYSCLGNYARTITGLIAESKYIEALEQCVASCKSLNFSDSYVMREMMKLWYGLSGSWGVNAKCIELPDGKVVKPLDAIKFLKEGEASGEAH